MQVEMQKAKENIGCRQKGRTESESNGGVQTYMGIVDDNLVEVQLGKDGYNDIRKYYTYAS